MTSPASRTPQQDCPDGPLPNRFTASTAVGCLGIGCVLALPAVLFLPLEQLGLPLWGVLLLLFAAFCLLGAGVWLMWRVPAGQPAPPNDPLRPLTRTGLPPLLERPASRANRVSALLQLALWMICLAGFGIAAFGGADGRAVPLGLVVAGVGGLLLTVFGVTVAMGWLVPPAWRWIRVRISARMMPRGGASVLAGMAAFGWALLIAWLWGAAWGAVGIAALVLFAALMVPFVRRVPRSGP